MEKLTKELATRLDLNDNHECLTCGHDARVNLFPVLQNILEENGLSAEKFAATSKKFRFENGRLRARCSCGVCISLEDILDSLNKM